MATDNNLQALFGGTMLPQDMQQELINKRAQQFATLTPSQQLGSMGYKTGAAIGGGLAQAMGVDITDPQIKIQSQLTQLSQGIPQTAEGLAEYSRRITAAGLPAIYASQAMDKAREIAKTEASSQPEKQRLAMSLADTMAKRGTPEWMKSYQESLADVINPEKRTGNQKEYQQAVDEGSFKGTFTEWLTADANRRRPVTNVSVSTGENAYGTAFGKGIADQDLAKYTLAQKAPEILAAADSTEKLLQSGKVFTGTGASAKLNVLALGQGLGVTGKNADEVIANTQQLQQQRSQAVLSQIKASGLGTGQGFTDKDLKFLQDSAAGSITLSKDTLQRQVNIERAIARAAAKDWNNRLGSMPQKVVGPMGLSPVSVPNQTSFSSVEEAMAAKLPKGTKITVNGRPAEVQ